MKKKLLYLSCTLLFCAQVFSQTVITSQKSTGTWYPVMLGDNWDYINDGDTGGKQNDLVGDSNNPLLLVAKTTSAQVDISPGSTTTYRSEDIYHFRFRIGQLANQNKGTFGFLALDVDQDNVGDIFIESDGVNNRVIFHKADKSGSNDGTTPAKSVWYNATSNDNLERNLEEFYGDSDSLDNTNSNGFTYDVDLENNVTSILDIDGDKSTDGWQEFAFSESALIDFAYDALGQTITGDSSIALFFFTTQGNTTNPNGDIAGVNGSSNAVTNATWESLGIVLTTSLDGVSSGNLISPTVNNLSTSSNNFTLSGTWGGDFGGSDSLSVKVNNITYDTTTSPALTINGNNWSLALSGFSSGTYDVEAKVTTTRSISETSRIDSTSNELEVLSPGITTSQTSLTVSESGTNATFTVVLDTQPTADVTIALASDDTGESSVSPESLTFTSSDWNTAQTVTVTGVDDVLIDGDQSSTITLTPSSTDTNYNNLTPPTVSVTTTDNDTLDTIAPTITGEATKTVNENTTAVQTFEADETVTWSITGTDSSLFTINATTGVLVFNAAPDYEVPADDNEDNDYVLTVTATDTANNQSTLAVTVTVADVDEKEESVNLPEGSETVKTFIAGEGITWSLSGIDSNLFSINSTSGEVRFKSLPDFENPEDSNEDNVYEIIITGSNIKGIVLIIKMIITIIPDADGDGLGDNEDPDDDNDGVEDIYDACPGTAPGTPVDVNGCDLLIIPTEDFTVSATSATCSNTNDGEIVIEALDQTHSYLVTVTGQNQVIALNSAAGYSKTVSGLAKGTYTVCFKVVGDSFFEQCYTVYIDQPEALQVVSSYLEAKQALDLRIAGATEYYVELNGVLQTRRGSRISLALQKGMNRVKIYTDLDCQGVIEEEVFVSEDLEYAPNPVADNLNLYVGGTDTEVSLTITDLNGVVIERRTVRVPASRIYSMNMSRYTEGVYILKAEGVTVRKTIKVVKR